MDTRTSRSVDECVRVFQECIRKRPLKLKAFPFKCESPKSIPGGQAIAASFQIAEPYGVIRMECSDQGGETRVVFFTDGNIRGRLTANSMAKHIAAKLA
jgi:hypothetical protein